MFAGLRMDPTRVVIVVTLLAYGCPIQAIVKAYGLDERTIADWRDRAGQPCQAVHEAGWDEETWICNTSQRTKSGSKVVVGSRGWVRP
jgi:hypothetical protein